MKRFTVSTSVVLILLGSILLPGKLDAQSQHGRRMFRGPFLDLRSYPVEGLGPFFGYGGWGGSIKMDGIVTGFGTTIGTLSENTVPYTAEPTREFAREIEIDRHVSGWGFDLKWMSKIFFQRDVDVSGFYSASGISLDFVFLKSSFDATAEQREYHIIPDDGDLDVRFDIFLDLGIGYQIDLGMSNIGIGLRAGLPFMGFLAYRGSFDVNDTDRGIGMPFYWGPRIGFYM